MLTIVLFMVPVAVVVGRWRLANGLGCRRHGHLNRFPYAVRDDLVQLTPVEPDPTALGAIINFDA